MKALPLAPYVVGYSLFNGFVMRFVRLAAYLQEWVVEASYRDTYVPSKVHRVRKGNHAAPQEASASDNISQRAARHAWPDWAHDLSPAASVFGLTVINYMFGDYVLLEADGLVLRDQHVVATTYVARVDGVDVTEGQAVEAGNPLVKLQSTEILERLADLSTKRADLVAKETDFKVKAASVAQLLPLAERRVAEAVNTIKQFERWPRRSSLPQRVIRKRCG